MAIVEEGVTPANLQKNGGGQASGQSSAAPTASKATDPPVLPQNLGNGSGHDGELAAAQANLQQNGGVQAAPTASKDTDVVVIPENLGNGAGGGELYIDYLNTLCERNIDYSLYTAVAL